VNGRSPLLLLVLARPPASLSVLLGRLLARRRRGGRGVSPAATLQ
jgi:hypothetical protein